MEMELRLKVPYKKPAALYDTKMLGKACSWFPRLPRYGVMHYVQVCVTQRDSLRTGCIMYIQRLDGWGIAKQCTYSCRHIRRCANRVCYEQACREAGLHAACPWHTARWFSTCTQLLLGNCKVQKIIQLQSCMLQMQVCRLCPA